MEKRIFEYFIKIWNMPLVAMGSNIDIRVSNIALALILIILGIKFYSRFRKVVGLTLIKHITTDQDSAAILEKVFSFIVAAIYLTTVLQIANIPLNALTVIGGGLGIGIGFGAQNFFNNFISGAMIMVERPFKIGDIISLVGVSGVVNSIGVRCTTIINESNILVAIPNSKIIQENLSNWSATEHILKCRAEIKINKSEERNAIPNYYISMIKNIESMLLSTEGILDNPAPKVYLTNIDANNYIYQLEFSSKLVNMSSIYQVENAISCNVSNYLKNNFTISYSLVSK